ncbi:MAG: hypothetical protein CMI80_02620 [Candidatus Pelagibacter sp.]|nr:hypothetical protein [Candidatus Pelagibacter sp.]
MDYLLLFSFSLIIIISSIGYGFLISNIIEKNLLKFNLGYQGLLGIFFLTLISYISIFFTKHNYFHNIIIHIIGFSSFIYFLTKKRNFYELKRLIAIFLILFIGILIIVNHDDFNYYHLTYSLGLTENKIFFGLAQFQHGYKHHSSIFFFNSIIYLPFIKYYLFHSIGWFTIVFANYIIIDYLIFKVSKNLKFEHFFYLLSLIFINIKFCRMGGYGTDLSGQIILIILLPLIYSTLKLKISDKDFKSNLSIIILLISYTSTLKSFFILNFLFIVPFLIFFNIRDILNFIFVSRTFLISFTTIIFLFLINIAYTGCVIYPIKETCFEKQLSWSQKKDEVQHMSDWYQQWSKAGAGVQYRVKDPKEYIKKFNWVPNWYEKYFKYKFIEALNGILVLSIIFLFIFRGINKEKPDKKEKRIFLAIYTITIILFFEWFYNHPALRYGGYHLLCMFIFIPLSYFFAKKNLQYSLKKKSIIVLIIFSFLIFNLRNVKRINEEFVRVPNNNFPLFFAPIQESKELNLEYNVKVYKPVGKYAGTGCWVVKTPCVSDINNTIVKKKYGFTIFVRD